MDKQFIEQLKEKNINLICKGFLAGIILSGLTAIYFSVADRVAGI